MLQVLLVSSVFPALSFAAYYALWRSPLRERLARWKVRPDPVGPAQLRFEMIWTGLYPFLSTAFVLGLTWALERARLSQVYYDFQSRSVAYFAASAVGYVLMADLFRYLTHRLMHLVPWLYAHVHSWHHRSVNVNPLSTLSMHPLDLVSGTPWLVATNVFPVHISVVVAFANFYHLQNLHRHLGYDFWGPRSWLMKLMISPRNHDLHHTRVHGNYGATFTIWDHLFGTTVPEPGEEARA